jgi:hypothetical protein
MNSRARVNPRICCSLRPGLPGWRGRLTKQRGFRLPALMAPGKARRREITYTMLGGAYHFSGAHLAAVMSTFEELPRSGRAAAAHTSRTPRAAPEPGEPVLKARPPRTRPGRASDGNP